MAYAQIHTAALRHAKIITLSDGAFRLWVAGLTYCQEQLTDGLVRPGVLTGLGVRTSVKLVAELEGAGLWEAVPGTGWQVHDYLDWNQPREVVLDRRNRARIRMQRARERSPERSGEVTASVREPIRNDTLEDPQNGSSGAREARGSPALRAKPKHRPRTAGAWQCPHTPICRSYTDCTARVLADAKGKPR